ncbi:MAG: C-type lectin domain-containing protein, partial [Proteobacteria bacterium]|nr:C-type lectin domain-containing protein [Pseudomonadota bacterium]
GFQSGASSIKKDTGETSKKSKSVPTSNDEMANPDDPEIIATSEGNSISKDCVEDTFNSKRYLICKGSKSKIDAGEDCKKNGMALVHIDSVAENNWIVTTAVAKHSCLNLSTSYWVANLTSENPGKSALWTSGQKIWAKSEPLGDGNDVHILRYCDDQKGWNDLNSGAGYRFGWVCRAN